VTREELRARVAAQVAATRARQDLGPTVTDPTVLGELAAAVAAVLVRQGATDDAAGPKHGSRRRREAGHTAAATNRSGHGEA
jgi:hypothetical protein